MILSLRVRITSLPYPFLLRSLYHIWPNCTNHMLRPIRPLFSFSPYILSKCYSYQYTVHYFSPYESLVPHCLSFSFVLYLVQRIPNACIYQKLLFAVLNLQGITVRCIASDPSFLNLLSPVAYSPLLTKGKHIYGQKRVQPNAWRKQHPDS